MDGIDIEITASTAKEAAEKLAEVRKTFIGVEQIGFVTIKLSDEKRDKSLDILNSGLEKIFAKLNKS